jgi:hypothetical protein
VPSACRDQHERQTRFDFNRFLNFSGDTVVANIWTIGLAARFYIAN